MARIHAISWPMSFAVAALAVDFCVSANLLTWIGVPYVTEGGFLPEKLHPGTYLLCFAFLIQVASQTRPNMTIFYMIGGDSKLTVYFVCLASCFAYMGITTGTGSVIVLLDTFLPAGMLACILREASEEELQLMLNVFRCGICANGLLALAEASVHETFIPLYLNDIKYHAAADEFRPTALYDHPLTGGVMTLMGLALAPKRLGWRFVYFVLADLSLIAFGGRSAVVVALLSAFVLNGVSVVDHVLRRDPAALRHLVYFAAYPLICGLLATSIFQAGFGERLLGHLYWDPSAQIRLAQWNLLGNLTAEQLFFGASREDSLALLNSLWLQSGVGVIENFWLLLFVNLGAIGYPLFLIGFSALLAWCWQRTGLRGRILLLSALTVVSTSNSLGRKSTLLVGLVAAIACMPKTQSRRDRKIPAYVAPGG